MKSNLLPQFQRFISRLVPAILFQIEIGDNNGAGMTNHQQFILLLVPAISWAGMTSFQLIFVISYEYYEHFEKTFENWMSGQVGQWE